MAVRRSARGIPFVLLAVAALIPLPAAAAGGASSALPGWFSSVPDVPTFSPASSCQFQQWSWQTFLALLTSGPSQPVPRYFTWDLPKPDIYNLYGFCDKVCGSAATLPKNPCGGPATEEVVNATTQPGFVDRETTSGAVIDQPGKPVSSTAHVSPQWVAYVTAQRLYDPGVLAALEPHQTFPAGAFEIKTSWRLADDLSRQEKAQYYVTRACVVPEDATIMPFHPQGALLGVHITGGATGHPELIWATFEHVRNAPDCDDTPQPGPWALYDGLADCRARPSLCNQPNKLDEADRKINVCRKYSHGGAAADVARQIDHLNRDVQARLPLRSPLRNYELIGSLWAADPSPAGVPPITLQEPSGSPLLSNTTLETFKQNVSCFGCHSSQFPGEFASFTQPPSVTL